MFCEARTPLRFREHFANGAPESSGKFSAEIFRISWELPEQQCRELQLCFTCGLLSMGKYRSRYLSVESGPESEGVVRYRGCGKGIFWVRICDIWENPLSRPGGNYRGEWVERYRISRRPVSRFFVELAHRPTGIAQIPKMQISRGRAGHEHFFVGRNVELDFLICVARATHRPNWLLAISHIPTLKLHLNLRKKFFTHWKSV